MKSRELLPNLVDYVGLGVLLIAFAIAHALHC